MRSVTAAVLFALISVAPAFAHRMLPLGVTIRFADEARARKLVSTPDAYTAKWSPFDIQSRLQNVNGKRAELYTFQTEQVIPWTVKEEQKIREVLGRIDASIRSNGYYFPLPDSIWLIKSTLKEEGGAGGYTRGNFIVLRQDLIFRDDAKLEEILLHEIFHVLTRHSPQYRSRLYEVIGFTVSNPIPYPPSIKDMRVTNPDAHNNDSYIRLTTTDSAEIEAVMMLYADRPYEGGLFFQYLQIGFVEVSGPDGRRTLHPDMGPHRIHSLKDVPDFLEQVGRNTQYLIDPEEILADNFAYTVMDRQGLPDMHIVESIRDILRDHGH